MDNQAGKKSKQPLIGIVEEEHHLAANRLTQGENLGKTEEIESIRMNPMKVEKRN